MGISYQSKKCPSCGSTKFDYINETKMWECAYCGTMIERHEQQDTLFTIKNVVRQVLVDVSYQRFQEAKNNLVESEKIDSRYVGTIIAKICYYLNAALFDNISQQEQRNMFAQVKKFYSELVALGESPTEEEIALYEFLESAEAYGTLILAYDTLNCRQRIEPLYEYFKPDEVYSLTLNSNLLKYMVNHQKYEIADKIVSNYDNLEKRSALEFLLGSYPDGEQKTVNCNLLISQDVLTFDERGIIESYLDNSADSVNTKYSIACAALQSSATPSVRCVMSSVVSKISSPEEVKSIFDIIMSKKLSDNEVNTITAYALQSCTQEVILYIINLFKSTNQFVVFSHQHFITVLENQSISYDYKKKIIDAAISFNVTEKVKEQFVSHYLNNISDSFENRSAFIEYLFSLVSSISTVSAESYILSCSIDGENKPEIVKRIFELETNRAFFRETLDKYVNSACDAVDVRESIIDILIQAGLVFSENALVNFLINSAVSDDSKFRILKKLKNTGAAYLGLLDKYLIYVPAERYSGMIMQELIDYSDTVSAQAVAKYILQIRDVQTSKDIVAKKLVDKCKVSVLSQGFKVNHLNNAIDCNTLQAYILISPDSPEITVSVLEALGAQNVKLNTEIFVAGLKKKFKKYLSGAKGMLSPATLAAANQLGLI